MASGSEGIELSKMNNPTPPTTKDQAPEEVRVAEADQLADETPPPPVDFHQLRGLRHPEVVDWLDRLVFFKEFNEEDKVAQGKDEFSANHLSGAILIDSGYDPKDLQPALPLGMALRVSKIVRGVYRAQGIFPTLYTNKSVLTIN